MTATTVRGSVEGSWTIPNIPTTDPRRITEMDLLTLRDANDLALSPDGSKVAFRLRQAVLETNDYRTAWFVVDVESRALVNVGDAGEVMWDDIGQPVFDGTTRPQWSPDGRSIVYLMKRADHVQLWRSWIDRTGAQEQLNQNDADVRSFRFSPDGSAIWFVTAAAREALAAEERRLDEAGVVLGTSVNLTSRRRLGDVGKTSVGQFVQTWVYELESGVERKATSDEVAEKQTARPEVKDRPYARSVTVSPDGKQVAFLALADAVTPTDAGSAWAIYLRPAEGGGVVTVLRSPEYLSELAWSANSRELYYCSTNRHDHRDGHSVMAVSVATGKTRAVYDQGDYLQQIHCSPALGKAVGVREGLTEPGEVAVLDLATGELRVLTDLNPEFRNIHFSAVRRLDWENKYGDWTFAHLVEPLDYQPGTRYPLVVTTYRSGGFLRGGVGDEYPVHVFAANGFFVLSFDRPRLYQPLRVELGGTGADFADVLPHWDGPVSSLEIVVQTLIDEGLVDAERAGVSGLSNGAEISHCMLFRTDLFRAGATSGPSFGPLSFDLKGHEDGSMSLFAGWGLFHDLEDEANLANWKHLSPALNADRVDVPHLLQVADSECIMCMDYFNALKRQGKPVEMIIYPEERHLKMQPKHRYAVYRRNVDWFFFWLQGIQDPDPEKTDQYKRWETLRAPNRERA